MPATKVVIIGGGVAGLSAAHELAEKGFAVTVLEKLPVLGGKARSFGVPNSGTRGRPPLPAEHGFRFFPGFYRHLPDTMKRIPYAQGAARTVFDNLTAASTAHLAQTPGPELVFPARFSLDERDIAAMLLSFQGALSGNTLPVPPRDLRHFLKRILVFLTTSHERRLGEYELKSWWEFSGAATRSPAYRKFLVEASRSLVAARADKMSAQTGGSIIVQLLFDLSKPWGGMDRLLNGPTSDVWITPWQTYLTSLGVDFVFNCAATKFEITNGTVSGVRVAGAPGPAPTVVTGDYYIAAVPVEAMEKLIRNDNVVAAAAPQFADFSTLKNNVAWMNGVQFFLKNDVPITNGHTIYVDAAWGLTSVSQAQFWPDFDLSTMGNGQVNGVVSACLSDWDTVGGGGKTARQCGSRTEIVHEVWSQMKAALPGVLQDSNLARSFLDPAITFQAGQPQNAEPLLVNVAGSWARRPEAATEIANLFLASDYVRTHTDLATMEGANEAARRAVNGILRASGSTAAPCAVWELREPAALKPFLLADRHRFNAGLPYLYPFAI